MAQWETGEGIVEFPSGRRIRCRSWSDPAHEAADRSVLITSADLSGKDAGAVPIDTAVETVTIDWADGRLPRRLGHACQVLRDSHGNCANERVELVGAGASRIGASLAIMAIQDGLSSEEAIAWVGQNYAEGSVDSHALRAFIMEIGEDEGEALPQRVLQ